MKRLTLLLVPLCLAAAGCAGSALRPDDTQQQEMQALKTRIVELQREATMNQVELARLRQQVAELEARNGGAPRPTAPPAAARPAPAPAPPAPAPPAPAPPAPAPQTRRPEPERPAARPAEPIEEVDIALPETGPQPPPRRAPASTSTSRPAAPAPAAAAPSSAPKPAPPKTSSVPATPQPQPPAPAPVAPAVPAPSSPGDEPAPSESLSPATQALYDRGYTLFNQGHFVDAEASFQRFLQANPGSELADNAQYGVGECYFAQSKFDSAAVEYARVEQIAPQGDKVPAALYKLALSQEKLGQTAQSKKTLEALVQRFPQSGEAQLARERLGTARKR